MPDFLENNKLFNRASSNIPQTYSPTLTSTHPHIPHTITHPHFSHTITHPHFSHTITHPHFSHTFTQPHLSHAYTPSHMSHTVIWLYFTLKIIHTLLFRVVLISYAPHIVYETRVKITLLNNIRSFNFRTDGSVRN